LEFYRAALMLSLSQLQFRVVCDYELIFPHFLSVYKQSFDLCKSVQNLNGACPTVTIGVLSWGVQAFNICYQPIT